MESIDMSNTRPFFLFKRSSFFWWGSQLNVDYSIVQSSTMKLLIRPSQRFTNSFNLEENAAFHFVHINWQ
jgi:hypothetical protein